jgi:hypothetical protein
MPKNAGEKLPTEAECMFVPFSSGISDKTYVAENEPVSGTKRM